MQQLNFDILPPYPNDLYRPYLTAVENGKGVLDVDTVKGCSLGMKAYPDGGCYGECYAYKTAARYGLNFSQSVSRKLYKSNRADVFFTVKNYKASWYRVGTSGDPCHDWENTIQVLQFLRRTGKTPVIITKHWIALSDSQLLQLNEVGAVINTSVSALDTEKELNYRIEQIGRIKYAGLKSVARVVTCCFGPSAKEMKDKQDYLLSFENVIDNPLRASRVNKYVQKGDVVLSARGGWTGNSHGHISLHCDSVYLGTCGDCPDQCGVDHAKTGDKNGTGKFV